MFHVIFATPCICVCWQAGYTPLHTACHFGQMNMIRFLLDHGASVNATTKVCHVCIQLCTLSAVHMCSFVHFIHVYQCPSVIGAEFLKSDALPDINQYWERILDILSSASNRLLREGTSLPFMSAVKASNRKRHCPKDAQNRKKMKKESQGNQLHGFTWKMVVKTACVLQFLPIYFIYGIYLTLEVT